MASVPTVHEDVHERTGEQQQERQIAERVGAVLGQEQIGGNREERERDKARPGAPEAGRPGVVVWWMRHCEVLP